MLLERRMESKVIKKFNDSHLLDHKSIYRLFKQFVCSLLCISLTHTNMNMNTCTTCMFLAFLVMACQPKMNLFCAKNGNIFDDTNVYQINNPILMNALQFCFFNISTNPQLATMNIEHAQHRV